MDIALSVVSVVELTHGIHRARNGVVLLNRRIFVEEGLQSLAVYPVTVEIAQLAGRIEGEEAARGFVTLCQTYP